jgi:hypothetical protein
MRTGWMTWTSGSSALIVRPGGGPVGVNSLAVAVGENRTRSRRCMSPTIMEGYLKRTPQGRRRDRTKPAQGRTNAAAEAQGACYEPTARV